MIKLDIQIDPEDFERMKDVSAKLLHDPTFKERVMQDLCRGTGLIIDVSAKPVDATSGADAITKTPPREG